MGHLVYSPYLAVLCVPTCAACPFTVRGPPLSASPASSFAVAGGAGRRLVGRQSRQTSESVPGAGSRAVSRANVKYPALAPAPPLTHSQARTRPAWHDCGGRRRRPPRVRSEPVGGRGGAPVKRDSETLEPGRRSVGTTRSRRYVAARTAAGKWLRTRGNGQRRFEPFRAIAPGTGLRCPSELVESRIAPDREAPNSPNRADSRGAQ